MPKTGFELLQGYPQRFLSSIPAVAMGSYNTNLIALYQLVRPGLEKDGENRMCMLAVFDDKDAADANTGNATSLRESLAESLIGDGSPLTREGEIIWGFDAEGVACRPITPGYMRYRAINFDPSK